MTQNHNYYNLHDISHQALSDHLFELVENTLQGLINSKCIAIEDEMDVTALNPRMVAACYNISYVTTEVYTLSLKECTKLEGLLEVVSSSAEFEMISICRHENIVLRRIHNRVPVKLERADFEAPRFKTFLLLQAHSSHIQLLADLAADQALVVEKKVLNLLSACMSSNAWLSALGAMDLSQMRVQIIWEIDSPLKQIPRFEPEAIQRCKATGIESGYDAMEMEDDKRTELLRDVATFANSCLTLDVSFELEKGEHTAGVPILMHIVLPWDADDDDPEDRTAIAPFLVLVVGGPSTRQLHVIKHVTVARS
ncbi:hypothetical protein PAXINDRAFT_47924, partial [Paxillus involutus ATCC 200175]